MRLNTKWGQEPAVARDGSYRGSGRRFIINAWGCLLASALVVGCGGGSDNTQKPLKIEYSDSVAAGTVENYTNANWLFDNYLGEYGIPLELKPQFMPALKMLANGFDLQMKTGQDVKKNIEQVHALFLQYQATDGGRDFFSTAKMNPSSAADVTFKKELDQPQNFVEPLISEADKVEIEKAKKRDEADRAEMIRMAKEYGLPYEIEEVPEQWFIYSPAMKGGGKGGGNSAGATKRHGNVRTWGWRRGDLVWVNGTGSIPGVPGHNAIVWGDGNEVYLVDSNTDVGVSITRDLQGWFERYTEVRALTPKLNWSLEDYQCYLNYGAAYGCSKQSWQRQHAWQFAFSRQGYPYNWNFVLPRDQERFYCSSLLWSAYDSVGFNLIAPWVLGGRGMVTPSQIRDSANVVTFKVSAK